jgi:L-asparaginase/Glu-tRNA(Gln) amidotransferase subunit D
MSTTALQGFASPNLAPLGTIGERVRLEEAHLRRPALVDASPSPFHASTRLDESVIDVSLFPGLRPRTLARVLDDPEVRGVVLRTYGAGNAPRSAELCAIVERAVRDGTVIVSVSQCPEGSVEVGRYAASTPLHDAGVVPGRDLTPEAALTKLMWLLATAHNDAARLVPVDLRGELTSP